MLLFLCDKDNAFYRTAVFPAQLGPVLHNIRIAGFLQKLFDVFGIVAVPSARRQFIIVGSCCRGDGKTKIAGKNGGG